MKHCKMFLCSRSNSRQILMALYHPRCGQITANQRAIRSKESSPYWRAGLFMLGPRRDSRHLRLFIRLPRVEVSRITRIRETFWMLVCRKHGLRTMSMVVGGLLAEVVLSMAIRRRYRSKLKRGEKQLRPRKKDRGRPLGKNKTMSRGWPQTGKRSPPDRDSRIIAQSRTHGSTALQ
jgi:hypothetical protein